MSVRRTLALCCLAAVVGACAPSEEIGDLSSEGTISDNGLLLDFDVFDQLDIGPLSLEQEGPSVVDEASYGSLLGSEHGEEIFSYIVTCALRKDQSLRVGSTNVLYSGNLGLADHWIDGECGDDCQRWISACVLAHTNAQGETVQLSARGGHTSLSWSDRIEKVFKYEEAAYYGNLFLPRDERFAALCSGDALYSEFLNSGDDFLATGSNFAAARVHPGSTQELIFTGPCSDVSALDVGAACTSNEGGYFAGCLSPDDLEDASATRINEVVTVFVSR